MGHFIVAGAGIAGLAAALALGREGHRVEVFERRPSFGDLGAGLQLSPNATRVADRLGILENLIDVAIAPRLLRIRRGRDGGTIVALPLAAAVAAYGTPFLLLHRADLHRVLRDAVAKVGIPVSLSCALTQFDAETASASLLAGPGAGLVRADGLIRADGVHAERHDRPLGRTPTFSGLWAWRSLVPAVALPDRLRAPESQLCLGRNAHVVHYPLRDSTLVNVVAVVPDDRLRSEPERDIWTEPGDPAVLHTAFGGWHASIRQLVHAAPGWRRWPLFDAAGGIWSNGRLTTVGDAAHPMLPFLAQGASQAFEDAAVLASAVAASPSDVSSAFRSYEARRSPRVRRVQEASRRQGRIYHLGGPAAVARDFAMTALGSERLLARMGWLYGEGGTTTKGEPLSAAL